MTLSNRHYCLYKATPLFLCQLVFSLFRNLTPMYFQESRKVTLDPFDLKKKVIPFSLLLSSLHLSTWHYSGQWDHGRHPPRWVPGKFSFSYWQKEREDNKWTLLLQGVVICMWRLELGQPFDIVREPAKEISWHIEDGRASSELQMAEHWWHKWENKLTDSRSAILLEFFFYEIITFLCSLLWDESFC